MTAGLQASYFPFGWTSTAPWSAARARGGVRPSCASLSHLRATNPHLRTKNPRLPTLQVAQPRRTTIRTARSRRRSWGDDHEEVGSRESFPAPLQHPAAWLVAGGLTGGGMSMLVERDRLLK